MRSWLSVLGFGAIMVGQASATTIFSEDFEGGLGAWQASLYYAGQTAVIATDPLQGDKAVHFGGLNSGGDIVTSALLTSATGQYTVSFDYLGIPPIAGGTGNGGFLAWSDGFPGNHYWLAGSITGYGPVDLIDDGTWHTYTLNFSAPTAIHLMLEDFVGAGGVPGDAYFDNIRMADAGGFDPVQESVPEPSSLALMGLALAGLAIGGRRFKLLRA